MRETVKDNIENLLRLIESGTREEVWDAAKRLEQLVAAVPAGLLRLLKSATQVDSRAAAAYVLGFGRYSSARKALEEVLENAGETMVVRTQAAEALAYIQSNESVNVLLKYLSQDDPALKYWCIFALGQIGDPRSLDALTQAVESVGDQTYDGHSLREEAASAISEIEMHKRQMQADV